MSEKIERRPFHETIVEAIQKASDCEEEVLVQLIKTTKIPENHDAIINAWQSFVDKRFDGEDFYGVIGDLLEQKREAEAEECRHMQEIAKDAREDCN